MIRLIDTTLHELQFQSLCTRIAYQIFSAKKPKPYLFKSKIMYSVNLDIQWIYNWNSKITWPLKAIVKIMLFYVISLQVYV